MSKFIQILKAINELIVFKHSVFALPFIFISMIVASKELNGSVWFGWGLFFLALFSAVSARNFAMAFNRFLDADIDALNPRTKERPSVDGRIGRSNLVIFIIINVAIFIISAYFINTLAFYLSFPILVVLGGYSVFKRFSHLAHLVLGLSLALAPIAGSVAVSESIPLWVVLLSLGVVFWVAGFDLLYSLQDIDFDIEHKLHSIPSKFGHLATFFISKLFHFLSILFWALFIYAANLGKFAWLGLLVSLVILYFEHRIVNKNFSLIDRAFFTLNGYLGIIFFILVLVDRIVSE